MCACVCEATEDGTHVGSSDVRFCDNTSTDGITDYSYKYLRVDERIRAVDSTLYILTLFCVVRVTLTCDSDPE